MRLRSSGSSDPLTRSVYAVVCSFASAPHNFRAFLVRCVGAGSGWQAGGLAWYMRATGCSSLCRSVSVCSLNQLVRVASRSLGWIAAADPTRPVSLCVSRSAVQSLSPDVAVAPHQDDARTERGAAGSNSALHARLVVGRSFSRSASCVAARCVSAACAWLTLCAIRAAQLPRHAFLPLAFLSESAWLCCCLLRSLVA